MPFLKPPQSEGEDAGPAIVNEGAMMEDHVYRIIQLVGSSPESIEEAIQNALTRAGKTLRNLDWFEVVETRGHIVEGNRVGHYQVVLKVAFRIED